MRTLWGFAKLFRTLSNYRNTPTTWDVAILWRIASQSTPLTTCEAFPPTCVTNGISLKTLSPLQLLFSFKTHERRGRPPCVPRVDEMRQNSKTLQSTSGFKRTNMRKSFSTDQHGSRTSRHEYRINRSTGLQCGDGLVDSNTETPRCSMAAFLPRTRRSANSQCYIAYR